jgi:DENN (AEX-3) domain
MEALRSLIFPLEWQSVYVPRLPQALSGCLECPGGFMIGMHLTQVSNSTNTDSACVLVVVWQP